MDILFVARRQSNEDRLFLRWCTSLAEMSFEEYKEKVGWYNLVRKEQTKQVNSHENEQTEEEILAGVKNILG